MTVSATRIQDKDTGKRVSVVQSVDDPTKYGVVLLNPDGTKIRAGGDVAGPNGATDEDIAIFDGTTGKRLKDSGKKVSDMVQTSGAQTVGGIKSFTDEPVLPSKTTDATNNGTKPATEAQVYNVADDLSTLDGAVVKTSGNQSVGGVKTFTDEPVLPSKTTDATNDGTKPATEAQVYDVAQAIPSVIDDLTSTSTNDALSANQGRILKGKIDDLMAQGKFLSLWDCTTGLPISFPLETPYAYSTGDYFMVEVISSAEPPVNYRPNGSSYAGTASSIAETDEVEVGDYYVYDGSVWLLASNHGKTVSFDNIAGDALDNVNLAGYLNTNAFTLSSLSDTTTAQAALDRYVAGRNPIVIYNDVAYQLFSYSSSLMYFYGNTKYSDGADKTSLVVGVLSFTISSGSVTTIASTHSNIIDVLRTGKDYTTPYTPEYNGSPATKKYVDDHGVPSGGNNGDVLTNVSGTPTWQAPTGGVSMSTTTATLTSAGWSSKTQTVSVTGVTASNTVIVSPAPSSINDYANGGVYCYSQGSGTLTFKCNTTPSSAITVNVVILS